MKLVCENLKRVLTDGVVAIGFSQYFNAVDIVLVFRGAGINFAERGKMLYRKFFLQILKLGIIFTLILGNFFYVRAGNLIGVCSTNKNNIKVRTLVKFVGDVTGKSNPKVCVVSSSKNDLNLFSNAKSANRSELNGADIVFVKNLQSTVNSGKILIALDCKSLKYCPNCLGVFYVKNSRTMLVIFDEELKKLNLKLPSKYSNYIDSKQYLKCN